jgi:hypothetical protein
MPRLIIELCSCRLFLGLLDLALTNAYIVHRIHYQRLRKHGLSHADFLATLHAQLLAVKHADMMEGSEVPLEALVGLWNIASPRVNILQVTVSEPQTRTAPGKIAHHRPTLTNDFYVDPTTGSRRRMVRACKVCSLLSSDGKRGSNSNTFCKLCSERYAGEYVIPMYPTL